jgi:hypothetical protein
MARNPGIPLPPYQQGLIADLLEQLSLNLEIWRDSGEEAR